VAAVNAFLTLGSYKRDKPTASFRTIAGSICSGACPEPAEGLHVVGGKEREGLRTGSKKNPVEAPLFSKKSTK